jgi:ubiquinone/menaquinone biosynthesis C-methylase UbiE
MSQLAKPLAPAPTSIIGPAQTPQVGTLFEQSDWLYILCREKLFRDDTPRMIRAFWPNTRPPSDSRLVELGCGPGFYSRTLAGSFPELEVLGVDQSPRQLEYAEQRAIAIGLNNCRFEQGDVLDATRPAQSFDYLIASRLFTVLPDPERALAEMFRVLKSGGRCFIAEPRFKFWASIPLFMMRLVATVTGQANGCREPSKATVFSLERFERLFYTQPWKSVRVWREGRYHYALCEKG